MGKEYLDKSGLSYFWGKLKTKFLLLSGGTMTGTLIMPSSMVRNTAYGLAGGYISGTAEETILYTGIRWLSGRHMPVIHITGYAYGLASPVEFKIGFYIYANNIGYCGVTNMGSWKPSVYLFKYTVESLEYVAVGLAGRCYFLGLGVDVESEAINKFNYINLSPSMWSFSFLTTAGTIPEPDGGVTCIGVPYKADILNPSKVNGHTVNSDVPANAKFTDTTYSAATTSAAGLMSAADKTKLNGITAGAEPNIQSNWSQTDTAADDYIMNKPGIVAAGTSTTAGGLMSQADKTKLNGIATGAEVNQSAFSNIKVGSTTVAADAKTDTLELVAGSNVTLTPDATNDKVTIAATNTTYSNATTSAAGLMSADDKANLEMMFAPPSGSGNRVWRARAEGGALWGALIQSDWNQTDNAADDYIRNKPTIPTLKNVFGKVKVGSTTIEADTTQDTLELVAGTNVTLTPDATNDKVTIAATGTGEVNQNAFSNVTGGSTTISATSKTDTLKLAAGQGVAIGGSPTDSKTLVISALTSSTGLTNGYYEFPNGMKVCWGRKTGCSAAANGSTTYTVNLPVTYTSASSYECFVGLYGAIKGFAQASSRGTNSFNFVLIGSGSALSDRAVNWFCIGY